MSKIESTSIIKLVLKNTPYKDIAPKKKSLTVAEFEGNFISLADAIESERESRDAQIKSTNESVLATTGRVDALETADTELSDRVDALETTDTELSDSIDGVKGRVDALETAVEELGASLPSKEELDLQDKKEAFEKAMDFQIALQSYITDPSSDYLASDLYAVMAESKITNNVYETLVAINDDVASQSLSTLIANNFNGTLDQLKTYLNSQPSMEKISLTSENEDAITEDFILKLDDSGRGFVYNSASEDSTGLESPAGSEWSIGWDFTKNTVDDRDWLTFAELIQGSARGVKVNSLVDTLNLLLKLELVMRIEVGSSDVAIPADSHPTNAEASKRNIGGYYYYKFQITDIEFNDGSSKSQSEGSVKYAVSEGAVSEGASQESILSITSISYKRLMIDPVGEQIWSIAGEYYSYLTALSKIADKTTSYEFAKYNYDNKVDLKSTVVDNLSELSERFGSANYNTPLNAGFSSTLVDGMVAEFELNSKGDIYKYTIDSYEDLVNADTLYSDLSDVKKDIDKELSSLESELQKRLDVVKSISEIDARILALPGEISNANSNISSIQSQIDSLDVNSDTYADDLSTLQSDLTNAQAELSKLQDDEINLPIIKSGYQSELSKMRTEQQIDTAIQLLISSSLLQIGVVIPQGALKNKKDTNKFFKKFMGFFEMNLIGKLKKAYNGYNDSEIVISDKFKGVKVEMKYNGSKVITFGTDEVTKLYSLMRSSANSKSLVLDVAFEQEAPAVYLKGWPSSFKNFMQHTDEFLLWIIKADKFESQYNFISGGYDTLLEVNSIFGSYKKELGDSILNYAKLVNLGARENYSLVELESDSVSNTKLNNTKTTQRATMETVRKLISVGVDRASSLDSTLVIIDSFEDTPMWFTKVSQYFIDKINDLLSNVPRLLDVDSIKSSAQVIENYVDNRYEFLMDELIQNIKSDETLMSNMVDLFDSKVDSNYWAGTSSFLSTDDYDYDTLNSVLWDWNESTSVTVNDRNVYLFVDYKLGKALNYLGNLLNDVDSWYSNTNSIAVNSGYNNLLEFVNSGSYTFGVNTSGYLGIVDALLIDLGYTAVIDDVLTKTQVDLELSAFIDSFKEFCAKKSIEYFVGISDSDTIISLLGGYRELAANQASIFRLFGVDSFFGPSTTVDSSTVGTAVAPLYYNSISAFVSKYNAIGDSLVSGEMEDMFGIARVFDGSDNIPSHSEGLGIVGLLEIYETIKTNYPSNSSNKKYWDDLNETLQNLSDDLENSKVDAEPALLAKGEYSIEISGQWYLLYIYGQRKEISNDDISSYVVDSGSSIVEYVIGIINQYRLIDGEFGHGLH